MPLCRSMTDVANIVSRFGGREVVADRFKLTPKAVEMWERRGAIPGSRHIPLLTWASESGISLSLQDLASEAEVCA